MWEGRKKLQFLRLIILNNIKCKTKIGQIFILQLKLCIYNCLQFRVSRGLHTKEYYIVYITKRITDNLGPQEFS